MGDSENFSDWDASESLRSGKSIEAAGGVAKKNKSAGEKERERGAERDSVCVYKREREEEKERER